MYDGRQLMAMSSYIDFGKVEMKTSLYTNSCLTIIENNDINMKIQFKVK